MTKSLSKPRDASTIHPAFFDYNFVQDNTAELAVRNMRRFNIDFPGFGVIFSAASAVDCLIKSGTGNYLEFQSLEGLSFVSTTTTKVTTLYSYYYLLYVRYYA